MSNGTVPRLRVREPQDEDLMGNSYVCARLKELMLAFETGQNADLLSLENVFIISYIVPLVVKEKYNPKLAALDGAVSPYIGGGPVRIDGKPRASGILDTVSCPETDVLAYNNQLLLRYERRYRIMLQFLPCSWTPR